MFLQVEQEEYQKTGKCNRRYKAFFWIADPQA
jgi:hypothetical protein